MPRAGLTSETVIDAGAGLLDEQGETGLSIAALADRLGVKAPSLYKHIDGMSGLRRGIMLRAKADLAATLGHAAIGRARDDALRSMALAYRGWAANHPAQYPMTMRAPVPADTDDEAVSATLVNLLATVVSGYRIEGDELIDAIRYVRSALHGFVDLETAGAFRLPRDLDRSFTQLIDSVTTSLKNWADR